MLATKPDTHQSTAGEDAAGDTHEQDGAELRTNLGIHIPYVAYFGPFSTFQPALSSLGLSSKKKCSNEMLDKIKAILRDT